MSSDFQDCKSKEHTDRIIRAFYNVYNSLGYGFLEKIYEKAMVIELEKFEINTVPQSSIKVYYDKKLVGEYYADLLVENEVIVEIKAVRNLSIEHEAQLLNYLKATDKEVGLLLNFGAHPEIRRKVYDNFRK